MPTATPAAPATLDQTRLQALLDDLADRHDVVGSSVAVLVGGQELMAAAGVADVRTRQPVGAGTVFQIGSVTKVYTATLVMTLVEEGLVALDDPIGRHLPDLAAHDDITVAHLLSHTAGLQGDVFDDLGREESAVAALTAAVAAMPRDFPAGTLFSYCNAGFTVLGRLAEVCTGLTWARALQERVLTPAGLTATAILPEDVLLHPHAIGHVAGPDGWMPAPVWTLGVASAPAGSLTCATAGDLLGFGRLHLHGGVAADGTRVLAEATVAAMQEPRVALPQGTGDIDRWGLGWSMADWPVHGGGTARVIGHDGDTIGQHAHLRVLPAHGVVVAAVQCGSPDPRAFSHDLLEAVLRATAGVAVPAAPTGPEVPVDIDPAAVVGTYGRHGMAVTIRQDGVGAFAVDVIPSGGAAEVQPPMTDLAAVALDDSRLLLQLGPMAVPVVAHEVGGERWISVGGRALKQVS